MISMIPKSGGPDALPYSPESDLRHCGVGMVIRVFQTFNAAFSDVDGPQPWLLEYAARSVGTCMDLADACNAMAQALARTIDDPDVVFGEALEAAGFNAVPRGIREAVAAQIGRQALGMTIFAVRDSRRLDQTGPTTSSKALIEAGAAIAAAMRGKP